MAKRAKAYECDRCEDSGTIARHMSGSYKCPGPVPEMARHCFEDFCDYCPEGAKARRECRS